MKKSVKLKPVKKLSRDYCGTCELRQLPKGTYFKMIDKNGKVSKETYIKAYYDYSAKKFQSAKSGDVWDNGRLVNGTQKVTTDFIY